MKTCLFLDEHSSSSFSQQTRTYEAAFLFAMLFSNVRACGSPLPMQRFMDDQPPEFEMSVEQEIQKGHWDHLFDIEPEVPSAPPPNFDDDE